MSLIVLPTELLRQIIKYQLPEGLESVALTCKALYQVSAFFFADHKRMRERYEHFTYSTIVSDSGEETWDPLTMATGVKIKHAGDLLKRIAEEPIIARYIKTADLKEDASVDEGTTSESVFNRLADDVPLSRLVQDSLWPYLRDVDLDPETVSLGLSPVADTITLLTMLPNIKHLALPSWWGDKWLEDEPLTSVLDAIINRANNRESYQDASLSKLSLFAPSLGTGYDTHNSLQVFEAFLALHSLREFYSGSLVAEVASGDGSPFHPRHSSYSPQLGTIELVGCVIGQPELARLLSRTPNLECLRMAHENKYEWLGEYWDVGATMATIQRVAGKHIKELCLSAINCCTTGTTLTDMSGFEVLKTLDLDVGMLLSTPYEYVDEGDESEGDDVDRAECDWAERFEQLERMPSHETRLVDLLPASIETVRVRGWGYPTPSSDYAPAIKSLRSLFRDFALNRPAQLPALKDISFSRARPDSFLIPEYIELLRALEGEGCSIVDDNGWASQLDSCFYKRFGVDVE
jgi:hypothetical protein